MIRSKKYKLNKEKNSYHPNSMANMMMMMNNGANLAVVVQSVLFNYAKNVPLLKNVSINVPKGKSRIIKKNNSETISTKIKIRKYLLVTGSKWLWQNHFAEHFVGPY